ncbi:serine/arginine repetitive matrix protein 1-like [Dermacentor silvarum]|uniref:serine/arginine repetitive matrix protein 1-like n=1 Tax=Dermacentor silvarum TaxID=543639 RepID=UPI00189A2CE4|nr:serine/arginine repetitive matrix protein 1-like [Dermacentor silvarum]
MAPPGRKRSRRRPTFVGLIESCKQQNCEAAARQVAVARLTRPAERGFRNQRESLPATRGETAAPAHLSRRLEQDLLSLVCEKRDGPRARQRLSSPSPQRPRQKGRSRESRGSRVQRRRKSSRPRRAAPSPSTSPSLSSSDRSREERLRSPRRRSHRSGSSDERSPEARAPPAAPMVRASFRRNARQFSPPARSSGDVIGSGGGSAGCRQPKLANEKREQHILAQSLLQLHEALDAKRRQLPWGTSVLADVRSYCREIARQAQSEVPPMEEGLSPSPQPQPTVEEEEAVPDPNFIVLDEEPGDDEVLFMELSSESSQTASPASSLLPDSPRGQQQQQPWREEEEGERLGEPEEEDVEEATDVVASVGHWQPGGDNNAAAAAAAANIPGTSASSFLVPWNRPAAAQAGPRLAPEPAPWVSSSASTFSCSSWPAGGCRNAGARGRCQGCHRVGKKSAAAADACCGDCGSAASATFHQLARGGVPADGASSRSAFHAVLVRPVVVASSSTVNGVNVFGNTASATSSARATTGLAAPSRGVHHGDGAGGMACGAAVLQPQP